MVSRITPLYDDAPTGGASTLPATTQGLATVLGAIASSGDAQAALAKIGGRKGYLRLDEALRVVRPL